jgi:hypothetical protein
MIPEAPLAAWALKLPPQRPKFNTSGSAVHKKTNGRETWKKSWNLWGAVIMVETNKSRLPGKAEFCTFFSHHARLKLTRD